MTEEETRLAGRRPCHGEVLVYKLAGGTSLKGTLTDVSSGGVRVTLDRQLDEDEVVRLVFSHRSGSSSGPGRTIIGHVVHTRRESDRFHVGIAFGWDAAVGGSPTIRRDPGMPRWLRFFSRKPTRRNRAASCGR
jgi:hypothetical protein